MTVEKLLKEKVYVPNYNDRYIKHLEEMASSDKIERFRKGAIQSLLEYYNGKEHNSIIGKKITDQRNLPSIFI